MHDVNLDKRLSLALFHLVTALAKPFTDHRISGRPMRVHFSIRGQCEQFFDNSPVPQFLFMELVVVDARCGDFVSFLVFFFFARSQYLSTHFFAW